MEFHRQGWLGTENGGGGGGDEVYRRKGHGPTLETLGRGETEPTQDPTEESWRAPWWHSESSQEGQAAWAAAPGGLLGCELSSVLCLSRSHTFLKRWHSF